MNGTSWLSIYKENILNKWKPLFDNGNENNGTNGYESIISQISTKVMAKTLAHNLIPVRPMTGPIFNWDDPLYISKLKKLKKIWNRKKKIKILKGILKE